MSNLTQIPRPEKFRLTGLLILLLQERITKGGAEPGLDIFIPQLQAVETQLGAHVTGRDAATATHAALLDILDQKRDAVDILVRHIESYTDVQGRSRRSPFATSARILHDTAFRDGVADLEDHVVDQNARHRAALEVLQSPEHAATIAGIKLPAEWIPGLAIAVAESETAYSNVTMVRGDKSAHVGLGRDAETNWVDVVARLRKQVASRPKRGDVAKQMEGRLLLEPLLSTLRKMKAEAAARATRTATRKKTKQPAATSQEAKSAATSQETKPVATSQETKPAVTSQDTKPAVTSQDTKPAESPQDAKLAAIPQDAKPSATANPA